MGSNQSRMTQQQPATAFEFRATAWRRYRTEGLFINSSNPDIYTLPPWTYVGRLNHLRASSTVPLDSPALMNQGIGPFLCTGTHISLTCLDRSVRLKLKTYSLVQNGHSSYTLLSRCESILRFPSIHFPNNISAFARKKKKKKRLLGFARKNKKQV